MAERKGGDVRGEARRTRVEDMTRPIFRFASAEQRPVAASPQPGRLPAHRADAEGAPTG